MTLTDMLDEARALLRQGADPAQELAAWSRPPLDGLAIALALRPLDLQAEAQGYPVPGEDVLGLAATAEADWGRTPAREWLLLASGQVVSVARWEGGGDEELLAFLRAPVLRHPTVPGWSGSPDRWRQLDARELELLRRDLQARGEDQARAQAAGRLGTPVAPADPDLAGLWGRLAEAHDEAAPVPEPAPRVEAPRDRFVLEEQHTHRSGTCPLCHRRGRHQHQRVRCTRCGLSYEAERMTEATHTCPSYAAPRVTHTGPHETSA